MVHQTTFPHRSNRRARAAAHRAMAISALASNSSLAVRYRRYHAHHMREAAALSRAAGATVQEVSE